ncbi:hypothetical protein VDF76_14350 [Xanthomonas campestris pv. raphani]|uniref:hypothetical protein n=1 Tax=Xanthomonas campestris TaxID=339 RepID=UPI002B23B3E4|nr:hypothetical protein [Xanthomonas campestris]MEA9748167.1 hypothetical protein [Xanthomonas campestris pv. raphani]MEA9848854.1 hypothetical protein [Xanthomonas campestris pv. raphani]MEA9930904.1 hypothetical protein [Xanthomonas campestris pv. raphani]
MTTPNLGDALNELVNGARAALFEQSELTQLTYLAFDLATGTLRQTDQESIEISFPVGYRADRTAIPSSRAYSPEELINKYTYLAVHQLSVNAIFQLVTIIEAMLTDVVRSVVVRYPQKLGNKRSVSIQAVLEASSLEEVHIKATDSFLNELSYKSPADFAEAAQYFLSINLLECPAFHHYLEVKASRDIFIHSRGVANEVYVRKSGTHARVTAGKNLPADTAYFLESLESCLQITEWLEIALHERWHCSHKEERDAPQLAFPVLG